MENLTTYYYEQAGQQSGPVNADQLIANGVTASTLVWQEGMSDWVPAATLPALAALFQPLPPPLLSRVVSQPPPMPAPSTYSPSARANIPLSIPQQAPSAPLPPVARQAAASTTSYPVSTTEPTTVRPQFSAPPSTRKWWHYVLYAIAFIFMWLLVRACGAIVEHAITATGQTLPAEAVTTGRIVGNLSAG